jgi:hypothetical protein
MKNKIASNILHKSDINKIGNELILTRRTLDQENVELKLSSQQLLRLVLLGCLFIELSQTKNSASLQMRLRGGEIMLINFSHTLCSLFCLTMTIWQCRP